MAQRVGPKISDQTAPAIGPVHRRCNRRRRQGASPQYRLPNEHLLDTGEGTLMKILTNGRSRMGWQRELSPSTPFGRGNCYYSALNVGYSKPRNFNRSQPQIDQTNRDGVITQTLVGLVIEGCKKLSSPSVVEQFRKSLVSEVGYSWNGQGMSRGTFASHVHETKKLPQSGEIVVDGLG
jgi:hypothetical protein